MRWRRELAPGQPYSLVTRLIGWDDSAFFLEHRFETACKSPPGTADESRFVNAMICIKMRVFFKGAGATKKAVEHHARPHTVQALMASVAGGDGVSPPIPAYVSHWQAANSASSAQLREEAGLSPQSSPSPNPNKEGKAS